MPRISRKEMNLLEITLNDDISTFEKTKWGIPEPPASGRQSFDDFAQNPSDILVIVPAVGLNNNGMRIGYGGGFYDRFLTRSIQQRRELGLEPTATIAIGLACQKMQEEIQLEAHDVLIDTVLLASE